MGIAQSRFRPSARGVLAAVNECAIAVYAARGWGRVLEQHALELTEYSAATRDAATAAAFDAGRRHVIGIVEDGVAIARQRYEDVRGSMDPGLRAAASDRLDQLGRQLDDLRASVGSASGSWETV
jgi:hypothetical protein